MKTKNVKLKNLKAKSMSTIEHYKVDSTTPPFADNIHKLFIDIYSNIIFPKPILQIILHCASCLNLFEDLFYLNELANRNAGRWVRATRSSNRDIMQLFKRFVKLYGSSLGQPQSIGAIELRPIPNPAC